MKKNTLKHIIKEAMTRRISEIDKAGNEAAVTAKLAKIDQDAKRVETLKTMLGKDVFEKYIDVKLLKAVIKDLESSAKELTKAKEKLEKDKAKKEAKAAPKPKAKEKEDFSSNHID